MTKTKIAIAAALFAATSSAALAQGFDPDLANRYSGYAAPNTYGYSTAGKLGSLQSAPVRLQTQGHVFLQSAPVRLQHQTAPVLRERAVSLPGTSEGYFDGVRQFDADRFDHASSPYAGGN